MSIALLQGHWTTRSTTAAGWHLRPDLVFADPAWDPRATPAGSRSTSGDGQSCTTAPHGCRRRGLREAYEVAADDAYCVVDFTRSPRRPRPWRRSGWHGRGAEEVDHHAEAGGGDRGELPADRRPALGLAKVAEGGTRTGRELEEQAQWALDEIRRLSNLRGPFDRPTWRPLTGEVG